MSKVSDRKKDKIKEDILRVLYEKSPMAISTFSVADEIVRDNEFVLVLLKEMEKIGLVKGLKSKSAVKRKRVKWRLSDKAFSSYKKLMG